MNDLLQKSLTDVGLLLEKGEVSSVEITRAAIAAMEQHRDLNAFITETPDIALIAAEKSDRRRSEGKTLGALDGIPVAIKDLFCTKDVKTTAASKILYNFVPPYSSTVVENLEQSGTVMVGKTNLDEFAMGSANMTSHFGPVKNPWKNKDGSDLVPGGSSGGSAAAVAAGIVFGATGTDTGGSIRQPASFTGTVGMKPTYGRCSRYGVVAFASSLDQPGPMTRTVNDAALVLNAMAGHDPMDATSARHDVPDFSASINGDVKGLRIGIPDEYTLDGMPGDIQELWNQGIKWFEALGAECQPVSLKHTKYALPAYYIIAPAEASSNLSRYDGVRYGLRVEDAGDSLDDMYEKTRSEGFGDEVKRRILIGAYVLSAGYYDAYYIKAQQVRSLIADDFNRVFEKVDVLLTPSTPSAAFAIGDKMDDPVAMYLNDVFTVPASLAGLPAISVPVGRDSGGLPLGLQLIAGPFDETTLFRAASALETAAGFDVFDHGKDA